MYNNLAHAAREQQSRPRLIPRFGELGGFASIDNFSAVATGRCSRMSPQDECWTSTLIWSKMVLRSSCIPRRRLFLLKVRIMVAAEHR